MKDRISQYPGRVKISPENGQPAFYAKIEMADVPSDPGTPLNKNNLLGDEAAKALELTPEAATPNDAFLKLSKGLSKEYYATLTPGGWGGNDYSGYTQLVDCSGMTEGVVPLPPMIVPTGVKSTDVAAKEALGYIGRVETLNGKIRVTCWESKPTVKLSIVLTEVK